MTVNERKKEAFGDDLVDQRRGVLPVPRSSRVAETLPNWCCLRNDCRRLERGGGSVRGRTLRAARQKGF